VTAAVGTTLSDGSDLQQRGELGEGADVETGKDGGCSLLVDEDALMELCGGTSVRLERKGGDPQGTRVVKLDRGEIRMVVEPRLGEERIEIHTPAAIATILGTIVHVSVDALGITTVASGAAKVMVASSTVGVSGATTLAKGESVVIEPGQPPRRKQRLDSTTMSALGGCLVDFHDVTLGYDRGASLDQKVEQAIQDAIADVASADVAAAAVSSGAGADVGTDSVLDAGVDPEGTLTPVETGAADDAIESIMGGNVAGGEPVVPLPGIPGVPGGGIPGVP
jgi:hypothetical protein